MGTSSYFALRRHRSAQQAPRHHFGGLFVPPPTYSHGTHKRVATFNPACLLDLHHAIDGIRHTDAKKSFFHGTRASSGDWKKSFFQWLEKELLPWNKQTFLKSTLPLSFCTHKRECSVKRC
jgi:hypothetical protein